MTQFIYRPNSGSRIFAERFKPELLVFTWGNGCRHVVGGTHLVLRPQGSREGREVARRLAESAVFLHGGVAWDEQGCVQVILPSQGIEPLAQAVKALSLAGGLLGSKLDLAHLGPQLFIQGRAFLQQDGSFSPRGFNPEEVPPVMVERTFWREGYGTEEAPVERRMVIETNHGRVTVPESWVPEDCEWRPSDEPNIVRRSVIDVEDGADAWQ